LAKLRHDLGGEELELPILNVTLHELFEMAFYLIHGAAGLVAVRNHTLSRDTIVHEA
jgi:hypothetical protein